MPKQLDFNTRLQAYRNLLIKWQKSVNLVAPSTLPDAWNRHFEDSLQLLPFIPPHATTLIDLGSGAGFPGLVLGIARPDLETHLIESDSKKAAFLSAVSRETGAGNITIHNGRIESVLPNLKPDVITARALAPLSELLKLCESQKKAVLLLHKGAEWQKELDLVSKDQPMQISVIPSKTDDSAAILCIKMTGSA